MVEAVGCAGTAQVLQVLLEGGEIFLSGGKVAGMEIAGELVEGLGDCVGGGSCRSRGSTDGGRRKGFLQGGEIGLRSREGAGLEILAELRDALLVWSARGAKMPLEEAAA